MPWYFGYASNMDLTSLRAKGVEPRSSVRAVLRGWRLRFNVCHFFRHEGGVANIERSDDRRDAIWGVLHFCDDAHLAQLDAAEAKGHGYERIDLSVFTERGEQHAITYVGMPSFIDEACRPSRRYLNILARGAIEAGINSDYVDALRQHPVHQPPPAPIFVPPLGDYPVFTAASLLRHPTLTALTGAVFDMAGARRQHRVLRDLFGGRDMTLFHLKRLDTSNGSETLADIKYDRLTPVQRCYLNEYLHEYSVEYVYAGRYVYD